SFITKGPVFSVPAGWRADWLRCSPTIKSFANSTDKMNVHGACVRQLVLLLFPALLMAQRYSFKLYGEDEGLGNLDVYCLMQDQTGFLWVGTEGGLFRYDGRQFRAYTNKDGLPSAQVRALHESADGVLWVGTREGLARLKGERF